jgi:hypothetical protein
MRMTLARLTLFAALATAAGPASSQVIPDFDAAAFDPMAPIDNPYFPLLDKLTRIFESDDGSERFELRVMGAGPMILDVQTTSRRDRAFEEGRLVEDTFDFYAQDTAGNVWYLGEDVTNYIYDDTGKLVATNNESAWRAGVNEAKPGFIMPADAANKLGFNYYQEVSPEDDALDQATHHALLSTFEIGSRGYVNVLRVLETTEVEPSARGFKFYAPGHGLIAEWEGLNPGLADPELTLELVKTIPEPSAAVLLPLGAVLVGGIVARRRRVIPAPGAAHAV